MTGQRTYLVHHRVDDVDEGLVAVEQAVPPAQDVPLEPALARVLREHLHDAAGRGQVAAVVVLLKVLAHPDLLAGIVDVGQLVGLGLVGPEQAEVGRVHGDDVAQEGGHVGHAGVHGDGGLVDLDGVVAEVGHAQRLAQQAAVGDGVGAHAAVAGRGQRAQVGADPAAGEQAVRLVAAHPLLEQLEVGRVGVHVGDGHLVGAPVALEVLVVDLARAGPALGGAQDDDGPQRAEGLARVAGLLLEAPDLEHAVFEGRGHGLVHRVDVVALDEVGLVAVADKEVLELAVADAGEDGRVVDLVAVEVQHGQHGAVGDGVEELGAVPRRRQRARLSLAVAHHGEGDQVGVVKDGAEGVGYRVAELAALVDAAGGLGGGVRADAAGEGELLEELLQALLVLGRLGVDLGVGALEVGLRQHGGGAVARPRDEDGVQVVLGDQAVEVHVGEDLAGGGAEVAQQAGLEVLGLERLLEQRVLAEVDHAEAEVQAGLEEVVVLGDVALGEGRALDGRASRPIRADALGLFRVAHGGRKGLGRCSHSSRMDGVRCEEGLTN